MTSDQLAIDHSFLINAVLLLKTDIKTAKENIAEI